MKKKQDILKKEILDGEYMNLDEWIIKGEIGISSKTIWAVMKGVVTNTRRLNSFENYDIPYDPDDFKRCYYLVRDCHLKKRLNEIVKVFPAWKPYIENWDKLEMMLIKELATKKSSGMYEFMNELEKQSKKIDGWIEISDGSWERQREKIVTLKKSGVSIMKKTCSEIPNN